MSASFWLMVLAALCFLGGAIDLQSPKIPKINWESLGLLFATIAFLAMRGA
jgi:hypothetical protein